MIALPDRYPFSLPPLPYAYDALEPIISKENIYRHYNQYAQGYVDRLNQTLSEYPQFQDWSLKALVVYADNFPIGIRTQIHNYAGGLYNHILYFGSVSEKRNTYPSGALLRELNRTYGSFEKFQTAFKSCALSVAGSGNAWLTYNAACRLQIICTSNQDTPPLSILNPLLVVDLWEHAYYHTFYFDRETYLDNWMKVVDWDIVSARYSC